MEKKLLEKIKAYEGSDRLDQALILNLSQFKEGAFLKRFMAPEFEKYDETGYLNLHTRLYVRRMG